MEWQGVNWTAMDSSDLYVRVSLFGVVLLEQEFGDVVLRIEL